MLTKSYYDSLGLAPVYEKVLAKQRLSAEDGLALFACPDVNAVGALAHHVRTRLHGNNTSYVVNRHINYTNVCVNRCIFCAFRRDDVNQPGAFTLTHDDILTRIRGESNAPLLIDELHIVGGCHPELPLAWFEEILRQVQALRPDLQVKAFTPVEIAHFAHMEQCSTAEVLRRLKDAGLKMMPGGGAEIFDAPLREHICPEKATAEEWLRISGEAHALGILTNATMLYGHLESYAQRIDHLCRLRQQQDKSHGFTCFIALPYLTENNSLHLPDEALGPQRGLDQLRTIAVSRLMLDNIPHLKAYWVMMGVKMAQCALHYGANDLDGTIVEEKIGHMAGADSAQAMTIAELEDMIRHSGFTPLRRNATFQTVPYCPKRPLPLVFAKWSRRMNQSFALSHSPFEEHPAVNAAAAKVLAGQRLTRADADSLYFDASLHTLAHLAHSMRLRLHPEPVVTYVGDRNINYSNICVCACRFCAFFRAPEQAGKKNSVICGKQPGYPAGPESEGYVISREELTQKIEETLKLGGTQILLQGGHHPDLPLEWYEDLLQWMHSTWPSLHIHAFSPPEIHFWAELNGLSTAEVLRRLKDAGLASLPGGGAEILHDAVRSKVSPNKCSAAAWLRIMEEAHALHLRSSATMMFGHEEEPRHRLDHLFALREVQDRTHGFTAFIPWTFQPAHTNIRRLPETAPAYLRLLAVSRLVLDNIDNIQSSWVTMGPQVAQLALFYGANDFGSLMIEENVVAAAGVSFSLSRQEIHKIIRAAGFTPVQRTQDYTALNPQPIV